MSSLQLLLLGPPRLERDNVPVELERRKALALLAYLAVTGELQSRDALATLLWPDKDESQAHAYLRRVLFTLKRALAAEHIAIGRERIGVAGYAERSSDFWLDVGHFRRLLVSCATHGHAPNDVCPTCLPLLAEAAALYRADFMAGFTLPDSPEFDEWQFFQAEGLRRDMATALERLVRGRNAQGELEAAIAYARRWLALDPLHEPAQRCLMRLYAQSGQRAAALRQYEESQRLLAAEVGGSPEQETTALYEAIKARRSAARGVGLDDRPSALLQQSPPTRPLPPFLSAAQPQPGPAAPFVAREQELAALAAALATACSGAGQIMFVIGGAGRGKTTLVQRFARQAQVADAELLVVHAHGNAHTGIGDPYLPFREALAMLSGEVEAQWAGGLISTEHARRLWQALPLTIPALVEYAPDLIDTFVPGKGLLERAAAFAPPDAPWFKQLAALTSAEAGGKVEQQQIFTQYTAAFNAIANQRPLLLILEDLHWLDAASSGLLFHLSRQAGRSRMLILGTYRPDEIALSRGELPHPLVDTLSELKRWHGDIWLDLGELAEAEGRRFVEAYLDTLPNRLGPAFREALFGRTGGHALYTTELLREMQARGDVLQNEQGEWVAGTTVDWNTLPVRVEGVIEKRIQRLASELQLILTVASVEGETFTAEVVARVQQVDERGLVRQLSRELDKRHRLVTAHSSAWLGQQRLSLYRFRHQLFQHYVYQNLAEMERAYLHEAVGSAVEALYGEQTEHAAVQLARHFAQAGLTEKAALYLLQAGKRAARLSANQEAIAHLTKGLALLESLPDTSGRAQKELELHIALGNALMATEGYGAAEVEHIYNRAWELGQQVYAGQPSQLFPILYGRWILYLTRGEHQRAYQLAKELIDLAQRQHDPAIVVAHQCMGWSFCMGELISSRAHFDQIAALYDVEQHRPLTFRYGQDPGMAGLSGRALVLWLLGYPEQAQRSSEQAIILGREASHAHSLASCLHFSSVLRAFCQEEVRAQELAEEAIAICSEQGLAGWLAWAMVIRGWALTRQGQGQEGIAEIGQGLAAVRSAGAEVARTYQLTLLVEAYESVGQPEAGLGVLAEAMAQVEKTEERFWEAEIYRLKGELLLKAEGRGMKENESPEECFLKAIEIARRQEGKSLELRATVSLGRLWRQQGKKDEARHMLAEIYGWFSEGFDTVDLQQANVLLEELSA